MKIIAEITDTLLGLESETMRETQIRYSSRGILFDDQGRIAMMNVRKNGFYKLPGGGMKEEDDNEYEATFIREIREETGWTCTDIQPLGMTVEIKSQDSKISVSFVFTGRCQTHVGTDLDAAEQQREVTLEWMDLREAIKLMENQERTGLEYTQKFIVERDLAILKFMPREDLGGKQERTE